MIDYRGKTPEKTEKGIPLITAKNVKILWFCEEPKEYISETIYEKIMTRGIPKANDVLFTTEGPLGNVCRVPSHYTKFCVGQRIITLQPKVEVLISEYLEYALLTEDFQNKVIQQSTGSTVKGIRSKLFLELSIPIPPLELQKHFKNELIHLDKSKFSEDFFLNIKIFQL